MDQIINRDFVACVFKHSNGKLYYKEIPVDKPNKEILDTIGDMVDDTNHSLIKLQEYANRLNYSGNDHNVCMPYSYNESFISAPKIPQNMSTSEYQEQCVNKRKELERQQREMAEEGWGFDVEEAFQSHIYRLKVDYFEKLKTYIDADQYIATLSKIKTHKENLMYSTETIGWTTFNYPISHKVNFEVKTNFGYGSSAYLYVNLTYKGIKIIPYSDIVRYYYANMASFGAYTRQYRPCRESWPIAFNFVVETANLAHDDPEQFVVVWVKNELSEMMKGFRELKQDPQKIIRSFRNPNPEANNYISVRNMQADDLKNFKVHPREMSIAYKAYKISGALYFLDNLQQLATIYNFVSDSIKELKDINFSLLPEIEENLRGIVAGIKVLNGQIANLRSNYDDLDKRISVYEKTLNTMLESIDKVEHETIKDKFKQKNPGYVDLLDKRNNIVNEIVKKNKIISERERFKKSLEKSKELIDGMANTPAVEAF